MLRAYQGAGLFSAGTAVVLAVSSLIWVPCWGQSGSGGLSDERFIASLDRGPQDAPVDRKRLAGIFSRVAGALTRGTGDLARLLEGVEGQPVVPGADPRLLRECYLAYTRNLDDFRQSVESFGGEPHSRLLFFRVFVGGQRTCWTLDLYTRLLEIRGLDSDRMSAMLPSREACAYFRTVVYKPRVEAIIQDALIDQVYERHEIGELRKEVRELEGLVDDLIEIDSP